MSASSPTQPPPATEAGVMLAEMRELRAAITNFGAAFTHESAALRVELGHVRVALLAQEGRTINLGARLEQAEADLESLRAAAE